MCPGPPPPPKAKAPIPLRGVWLGWGKLLVKLVFLATACQVLAQSLSGK